ncbi:MAG: PaaI family thioesterase [Candidatus Hodarchaeota archaeon]
MERLNKVLHKLIPYSSTLGLELKEYADGIAVFELNYGEHLTVMGMIHGGVLASLVDFSCAWAAGSLAGELGSTTTIDLQVEYLKNVKGGRLKAKGKCIKSGRNIFYCKAKVWNEEGELVCTGSSQILRIK